MMAAEQDELLGDLECPVCMEYLTPPIRMCTLGHSICDDCRSKITLCPLCANKFSTGRNVTLEHVAEKIKYPCTYRKYGCKEKLSCNELYNHQRNCFYMEIVCLFRDCRYSGSLQAQLNHYRSHYGICTTMKNGQPKRFDLFNLKILFSPVNTVYSSELLKLNDNYFWLRTRRFTAANRIGICVQMVGDRTESSKYKYEIVISKGDRRISYKDSCKSIYLNDVDLFKDSKSYFLCDRLYNFYNNNSFDANITIEKIDDNVICRFSWYDFIFFLFIYTIIIFVCQLNFDIDFGKFLTHSESPPKLSKNEYKHKLKKKYTQHFSNQTSYNYWMIIAIIFITITMIYRIISLIFKTLGRILTYLLNV